MRRPLTASEVADRVQAMVAGPDVGGRAQYDLAVEEGEAIVKDLDAKCATARALIGVYVALHVGTYQSEPEELRSKVFFAAAAAAKKFVAEDFGGDYDRAVGFVAWAFRRDKEKGSSRRLTWRHLFATPRYVFSDWRARTSRRAS